MCAINGALVSLCTSRSDAVLQGYFWGETPLCSSELLPREEKHLTLKICQFSFPSDAVLRGSLGLDPPLWSSDLPAMLFQTMILGVLYCCLWVLAHSLWCNLVAYSAANGPFSGLYFFVI